MIAVGVDTHKDSHYAVALDQVGQIVAELSVPATSVGYAELQHWAEPLADADELVFGLEGVGSWGAGLFQHLQRTGHPVVEVERPRRRDRRAGKSDRIDAIAAAKSVLTDERVATPRSRGILTAVRALLIARRSAVAERTRVLNQIQALNASAPTGLRERIGAGTGKQLERRLLAMRTRPNANLEEHTVFAVMRDLAAHSRALEPTPSATSSSSPNSSPRSIHAARRGGHRTYLRRQAPRLRSQPLQDRGAFARCNGTAPIPASSGKTVRYRLNPGGDRQANNAIHTIAIIRAKHQPETRAYLERRIKEGKTRREALRSLKRHISRELYHRLAAIPLTS